MTAIVHEHPERPIDRVSSLIERIWEPVPFDSIRSEEYQAGYLDGRRDILPAIDVEMTGLAGGYEVLRLATSILEPGAVGQFLLGPSERLGGRSPLERMELGDAQSVLELLAGEYEAQVK